MEVCASVASAVGTDILSLSQYCYHTDKTWQSKLKLEHFLAIVITALSINKGLYLINGIKPLIYFMLCTRQ